MTGTWFTFSTNPAAIWWKPFFHYEFTTDHSTDCQQLIESDPDFVRLAVDWPRLPNYLKRAVLAVVYGAAWSDDS